MTGPNALPTTVGAEALRGEQHQQARAIVIGSTQLCSAGVATSRPSTADSTEIAGVSTPSPKNSATPNTPRMPTT